MDMFEQFEQEMVEFLKDQGCKQCSELAFCLLNDDWVCQEHWDMFIKETFAEVWMA